MSPPLQIYAVNAGYKDEKSSQNFDFIELKRTTEGDLDLEGFLLRYYNSSGNLGFELNFDDYVLSGDSLILYSKNSPQTSELDEIYQYNVGSSGLASTAGKIELLLLEEKIDEVCWGKAECDEKNPKFETSEVKNNSLVRCEKDCETSFIQEKYYPTVQNQPLIQKVVEEEQETLPLCENIIISEYYSYYDISPSEQFIELYNKSDKNQVIDGCILRYKNHIFQLEGELLPGQYFAYKNTDLRLTKDPSSPLAIELLDADLNIVDKIEQSSEQRKNAGFALFGMSSEGVSDWRRSYNLTPGAENIYQEFQTCPEGKVINALTGNCIKDIDVAAIGTICPEGKYLNILTGRCKTIETKEAKTCKAGYYLNPETNRCKKETAAKTATACKEGYERNPETNRCRKIAKNKGDEYPVAESTTKSDGDYKNPKIFIATAAIIFLVAVGIAVVIYQYRKEIKKRIIGVWQRRKSSV